VQVRLATSRPDGVRIVSSRTDSPAWRVRPRANPAINSRAAGGYDDNQSIASAR
jgi:hypothetical protein